MMRREEIGSVLVYAVVTGALIGAIVAALSLARRGPAEELRATLVGASIIAIAGLARQARRDLDAVLMYLGAIGLSTAVITGVYILSTDGGNRPTQILAAGATVLGLASLTWTFIRQRSSNEAYPDILATRYGGHEAL